MSNTSEKSTSSDNETHLKTVQSGSSQRRVIYTKTSCYFCNEWLDGNNLQIHLSKCSETIVKCPNLCSSYVHPKLLDDHLQLCRSTLVSPNSSKKANNSSAELILERLQHLEGNLNSVRYSLQEETRQRHKLIVDIGILRRRYAAGEDWTEKVSGLLAALKVCLGEESELRVADVLQLRTEIGELITSYASTAIWRQEMSEQLDRIEQEVFPDETDSSWRTYIDVLMNDQRATAMRIYAMENDMKLLRQRGEDAQQIAATTEALVTEKCSRLDDFVATQLLERRATNRSAIQEAGTGKLATLEFELKTLKHICTSAEDKCDKLESILHAVRQKVARTDHLLGERIDPDRVMRTLHAIENVNGHLIWRITDFRAKMQAARDDDAQLHSPLFCDRQYGYTLRLDVHLNGMGKWRNRNILACLSVVPGGEWDTLLAWPCKLTAEIRLRDQPDIVSNATDVCKTIVAKGSVDSHEQSQYIFISHKALKRSLFVRSDTIFFEVRVHKHISPTE